MPRPVDYARHGAWVNVLKNVRTQGGWKLCPVVREANGRLRDRVRVSGRTEVHTEGVYYLEWREAGRRLREAIPNPAEVLERARLKSLEREERRACTALDIARIPEPLRSSPGSDHATEGPAIVKTPRSTMVYLKYVGRQGVHEIIDKSEMAELAANSFRSIRDSRVQ
jgi:hypothetical protein